MIYNVLDYGAAGDGAANDAAAIQAAIDDCSSAGGGRVLFPGGRVYRSGTIVLKSYVELHLETGAVLKGSSHLEDYNLFHTDLSIPSGQSTADAADDDQGQGGYGHRGQHDRHGVSGHPADHAAADGSLHPGILITGHNAADP